MGLRRGSAAAVGCWILILTGCATVPVEEVQLYTEAFDEARAAGGRLYSEIGAVVARTEAEIAREQGSADGGATPMVGAGGAERAICPRGFEPTAYPSCFEPNEFLPGGVPGEPASLAARRRALDTIATFNAVALRLASGDSAGALATEVRRLASGISALAAFTPAGAAAAPLGVLAGDAVASLAGWAETLRADRTLRASLAAGAPLVRNLLAELINDTPRMYALKREEVVEELEDLEFDAANFREELITVATGHGRPDRAFATRLAQVEQGANDALSRIGGFDLVAVAAAANTDGPASFDEGTARRLESLVAQIETVAGEHERRVAALNRYHAALGEYVRVLNQVGEALDAVEAALRAPPTVTVRPAALAVKAAEIRTGAREVRRLLDEL